MSFIEGEVQEYLSKEDAVILQNAIEYKNLKLELIQEKI